MTSLRYLCFVAFVLVEFVHPLCVPPKAICPQITPAKKIPHSAVNGTWYLYASTPVDTPNLSCSLFKTTSNCGCIGADLHDIDYYINLHKYSQELPNTTPLESYSTVVSLHTCDDSAVYKTFYPPNKVVPVHQFAFLGTDSGITYLVFYVCSARIPYTTKDGAPVVWFFSRTPVASEAAISAVTDILKANNLSYDILEKIDQTNCNYPV